MKLYIQLLQEERVLRRLSFIQLLSYFGAWFSNVAIYTLLLQMGVSAEVVAFVAMLHFIAGVVQAPFSGAVIDAFEPKKLMGMLIVCEIVATLCLVFIHERTDLPFLYILIFIKMAAASFYFTTEMSLLPKIIHGDKLQKANELHSIIWSLSYTLGMALSGFFVYAFGISAAFIFDAFMFVIAFYLLITLRLNIAHLPVEENLFSLMKATFSYIQKTPKALHLMLVHAFVGFSAFDALVALMVKNYYAPFIAASLALGLLHAFRAMGLVIGPMMLTKWVRNKNFTYVFYAQGVAIFLWAYVMNNFYLSLAVSIIVGLFTTTLWSYSYTLLQKNIEAKFYGRIVAYNDMLFLLTAAFTSIMIGYLAEHSFSLEMITVLMGCAFLLGGLYFQWVLKKQQIKEII